MDRILHCLCRLCVLLLCMASPFSFAQAPKAPKSAQACVACHSTDGNSVVGMWPKIAGQHEDYLYQQLVEFKKGPEGKRNNPVMLGMAAGLNDAQMRELAAYFSSQSTKLGMAKPEYVEKGAAIYRGGNIDTGVSACSACHGPQGMGNAQAGIPRLSGQHADYTKAQLLAYRDGVRSGKNGIMSMVAGRMSDQEMTAVASFIEGLY